MGRCRSSGCRRRRSSTAACACSLSSACSSRRWSPSRCGALHARRAIANRRGARLRRLADARRRCSWPWHGPTQCATCANRSWQRIIPPTRALAAGAAARSGPRASPPSAQGRDFSVVAAHDAGVASGAMFQILFWVGARGGRSAWESGASGARRPVCCAREAAGRGRASRWQRLRYGRVGVAERAAAAGLLGARGEKAAVRQLHARAVHPWLVEPGPSIEARRGGCGMGGGGDLTGGRRGSAGWAGRSGAARRPQPVRPRCAPQQLRRVLPGRAPRAPRRTPRRPVRRPAATRAPAD